MPIGIDVNIRTYLCALHIHTYDGEWEDKKAGAVSEGVQGAEGQTHLVKCASV